MSKINQISVDGVVYDIATKKEVELEAKINNKADKATTLDGYGITDAYTKDSVDGMLSQKNDILTFDTTPTADSTNPVTSGGVKVELDKKADKQNAATPEELERLNYYGNKDIVQSDESWFTVNAAGNTITGLTDTGKAQSGTLVIPYKINGKIITSLTSDNYESILAGALDKYTKVILPNSITNIGSNVFIRCTALTSINIPNSVSLIRVDTFNGCTSLTSINIPNNVTSIDVHAFMGCTSLISINIPNSVTSIRMRAFDNCTSLNKIEIPASVTYIEVDAFDGITPSQLTVYCEQGSYAETYAKQKGFNVVYTDVSSNIAALEELERLQYYGDKNIVPSDESYFKVNETGETITGLTDTGKTQTELVIPYKINGKNITTIGNNAFARCSSLTSINIPNSATSIGSGAFNGCTGLTSIDIPNSVISIGAYAFSGCTSLTSVKLPNNLTSIDIHVFNGCTGLTSIDIPNSVTDIGMSVFSGCTSLTSINIPNSVTSIGANAFINIPSSQCTIYCEQGSYAETYAQENGFNVVYTDISKTAFDSKADKTDIDALNTDIDTLKKLSVPHTTSSGYPVSVSDHLEGESVIDYKVYGNSVQDGTPTPDTPIEIQSVGDLVTDTSSPYYGKYDVPVTVCEKNLIPYPYSNTTETIKGITFTDNGDGTITANGTVTSTVQYSQFELKNKSDAFLLQGGTYTLSGVNGGSTTTFYIQLKNSDTDATIAIATNGGVTFNLNEPCYARGNLIIKSGTTVNNIVFKPQLELGTTATPYEPYQAPITKHIYLDEPLRKVGDYADYVDYERGCVVRYIKEKSLTSNDKLFSVGRGVGYNSPDIIVKPISTISMPSIFCSHYAKSEWASTMASNGSKVGICINTSSGTIGFYDDKYAYNLTTFKSFLDANEIKFYYILLTPIVETLIVPDFGVPNSEVMNVSSGTVIPPSSMDVTYYQDINKVITELKNALLAQGGNV